MPVDVKYTTQATATGGRDGRAKTADGSFDVKLATPRSRRWGRRGQQPGAAFRCRLFRLFPRRSEGCCGDGEATVPADSTVTATVGIGPRSEGGFGLEVALRVALPGIDRAGAERLVEKAHQICPYSNATRGNINVRLEVA